ncbi:hypothetical protein [Paracoccus sediminicola]|uniref:hypothetical protein n=1 Tax=Paracoccus sediminicola TaxID=3017783 RepID=UPI0022F0A684|nr:hypothetical protein [Paracoccus sediminicola]WBU56097.1 hypothetical protein PAF18_11415 [Paracoccus sediminicola]
MKLSPGRIATGIFAAALLGAAPVSATQIDPNGPFALGEALPQNPASCDTLTGWVARAPDHDGRISMAITGELVASDWDGALAYLLMCPENETRVICVTYEPKKIVPGQQVMLAGGYAGGDSAQVILDPCLASIVE